MIRFGVIKWVQSKEGSLSRIIYEYVNDCDQTHSIICVIMCLVQMTRLLHITKRDDINCNVHRNDFHGAMKIILKFIYKAMNQFPSKCLCEKKCFECRYVYRKPTKVHKNISPILSHQKESISQNCHIHYNKCNLIASWQLHNGLYCGFYE